MSLAAFMRDSDVAGIEMLISQNGGPPFAPKIFPISPSLLIVLFPNDWDCTTLSSNKIAVYVSLGSVPNPLLTAVGLSILIEVQLHLSSSACLHWTHSTSRFLYLICSISN